jgi:shikimate dehydrogenase
MPAAIGALSADTLVGDVVIAESPTPLIRHAIACGCPWVEGKDMHAGQIDALLDFFAGRDAADAAPAAAGLQTVGR